jgi:hypothetical protein
MVGEMQLNNAPIRPLNPPFWGTLKGSEVPQNGGFRGRISQCIPLDRGLFFLNSLTARAAHPPSESPNKTKPY